MVKLSPLGKKTKYKEQYSPDLLFPISRLHARKMLENKLEFEGVDIWNGYELSWLNLKGKPEVAFAEFIFPCNTPNLVESKSFKLYLNSFNQSKFANLEEVQKTMEKDLSQAATGPVTISIFSDLKEKKLSHFPGICLDTLDIETNCYQRDASLLKIGSEMVEEEVYSDLLKSNCLATGQPDWGSVYVKYAGRKIDHHSLLKYIISFRNHSGFAEHCTEQIFHDLMTRCSPEKLTVYIRYTRRGGLDINPFRSNFEKMPSNHRHERQ